MQFLSESQHKIILKSTHKGKETRITKSILKNEECLGGDIMDKFLSFRKTETSEVFQRKWGFNTDNLVITKLLEDWRSSASLIQ